MNKTPYCSGNGLSVLAKGKGLLNGGVEIECIPDFRHSQSLSGKEFVTQSLSVQGRHAKVYKPYSLALPKTFITRRGQMILFTAPEDMVIGQGLQCNERKAQVDHISNMAVKELKTVDALRNRTADYKDSAGVSNSDLTAVRPGCFTSVYLEKLRSIQVTDEKANEVIPGTPPELPITESDSGFDSSASHQTLNTSGRTSSLSTRTDSNIVMIPDAMSTTTNTVKQKTQVRFSEDITCSDSLSETRANEKLKETSTVTSTELSDIIFSLPQQETKQSKSQQQRTGKQQTTGKKVSKKKQTNKGKGKAQPSPSAATTSNVQENTAPNKAPSSCAKKKAKIKKKTRNQKERQISSSSSSSIADSGPVGTAVAESAELSKNIDGEMIVDDEERKDVSNHDDEKKKKQEQRKALQSARANERRLAIERKRLEMEALKKAKEEEERKQALLETQIAEIRDGGANEQLLPTHTQHDQELTPTGNELYTLPTNLLTIDELEQSTTVGGTVELTESERKLREAIERSRENRRRSRILENKRQQDNEKETEELKATEVQTKLVEEQLRIKAVEEAADKLRGKKDINYKMQLELLTNRQNQRLTTTHFFSYFSYLPANKKTNAANKKNSKSRTKR